MRTYPSVVRQGRAPEATAERTQSYHHFFSSALFALILALFHSLASLFCSACDSDSGSSSCRVFSACSVGRSWCSVHIHSGYSESGRSSGSCPSLRRFRPITTGDDGASAACCKGAASPFFAFFARPRAATHTGCRSAKERSILERSLRLARAPVLRDR